MIPLPNMPMPQDINSLSEDAQNKLRLLKFCVFGLYFFGSLRFIFGDPMGSLQDMMVGIIGTFLLSQDPDPNIQACYGCLARTALGACCVPGLQMLPSFMMISAINVVYDAIAILPVIFQNGPAALQNTPVLVLTAVFCFEIASAYLSYKIFVSCRPELGLGGQGGSYQPPQFGQGGEVRPPAMQSMGSGNASSGGQSSRDFVPFGGQGQKLGS
jgi:hypothetical protein